MPRNTNGNVYRSLYWTAASMRPRRDAAEYYRDRRYHYYGWCALQ